MSRQEKQMLATQARNAATADSFVPVVLLSDTDVDKCTALQFLEILAHLDELCNDRAIDRRSAYVKQVYHRMLHLLSWNIEIPSDRIVATVKQFVTYHPSMAILRLDDLKHFHVDMEKRSVIDCLRSMNSS